MAFLSLVFCPPRRSSTIASSKVSLPQPKHPANPNETTSRWSMSSAADSTISLATTGLPIATTKTRASQSIIMTRESSFEPDGGGAVGGSFQLDAPPAPTQDPSSLGGTRPTVQRMPLKKRPHTIWLGSDRTGSGTATMDHENLPYKTSASSNNSNNNNNMTRTESQELVDGQPARPPPTTTLQRQEAVCWFGTGEQECLYQRLTQQRGCEAAAFLASMVSAMSNNDNPSDDDADDQSKSHEDTTFPQSKRTCLLDDDAVAQRQIASVQEPWISPMAACSPRMRKCGEHEEHDYDCDQHLDDEHNDDDSIAGNRDEVEHELHELTLRCLQRNTCTNDERLSNLVTPSPSLLMIPNKAREDIMILQDGGRKSSLKKSTSDLTAESRKKRVSWKLKPTPRKPRRNSEGPLTTAYASSHPSFRHPNPVHHQDFYHLWYQDHVYHTMQQMPQWDGRMNPYFPLQHYSRPTEYGAATDREDWLFRERLDEPATPIRENVNRIHTPWNRYTPSTTVTGNGLAAIPTHALFSPIQPDEGEECESSPSTKRA